LCFHRFIDPYRIYSASSKPASPATRQRTSGSSLIGKAYFPVLHIDAPGLSFFTVTAALVITVTLLQNFLRSSFGRAILAVREDEIAANCSGISVFRYKMIGFVSAAFVAGLGGALYAMIIGFVKPDIASFTKSIDYLIFVVLGGMGSMTGAILAAYVLTYLQEFLRFLQDYRLLIYPLILIIVMLYRPQGLLGMKELSFVRLWERALSVVRKLPGRFAPRR
jgi:branched-chain amino acid transport system permease protein